MEHEYMNHEQIHLMLDAQGAGDVKGLEFKLNQARKHPENPVLSPGYPHQFDSLSVSWPATVLYDKNEKIFRCWYTTLDAVQENRPPTVWEDAYAESADGINWIKPELGQYEHLGLPTNKLVFDWHPLHMSLVMENPRPDNPEERFFALFNSHAAKFSKDLAISGDGKKWRRVRTIYEQGSENRSSFQDISQLLDEPEAEDPEFRIKGYTQAMEPHSPDGRDVRCIGLVHGKDFFRLTDNKDRVVLAPEPGIDEELHFATVRKIGSHYLMLFESDQFSSRNPRGDLRLAISDDGIQFRRVHPHVPLVATGAKGMWDDGMLVTTTSAMQEVGDEIWIYYLGVSRIYTCWPPSYAVSGKLRGSYYYPSQMGVAILPRDRFSYLQAIDSGKGELFTRTIQVGGNEQIYLNADLDDPGEMILELESPDGRKLCSGRPGEVVREGVYREIVWDRHIKTNQARLRIKLANTARLFSIKVVI
jgi:hypothetical protein